MPLPPRFVFASDTTALDESAAHVVRVPAELRRKRQLFAHFKRALELPDYFGGNWDALDECLRDLSWLAEPRRVVIVHEDVPFAEHGRNRRTYLGLLRNLTETVGASDRPVVTALFPSAARSLVEQALAQAD